MGARSLARLMLWLVVGGGGVVTLVVVLAVCYATGLRHVSRSHSVFALGRVCVALACVCVKRLLSIMHGYAGIW